jgi:hypothetical protein
MVHLQLAQQGKMLATDDILSMARVAVQLLNRLSLDYVSAGSGTSDGFPKQHAVSPGAAAREQCGAFGSAEMHAIQPLYLAASHLSQATPSEQWQQPKPFAIPSNSEGSLLRLRFSLVAPGQSEYCCSTRSLTTESSANMMGHPL